MARRSEARAVFGLVAVAAAALLLTLPARPMRGAPGGILLSREGDQTRFARTASASLSPAVSPGMRERLTGWEGLLVGDPLDADRARGVDWRVLPGVGEKTAQAILATRARLGGFSPPERLLEVPGIGEAKWSELKHWISTPSGGSVDRGGVPDDESR